MGTITSSVGLISGINTGQIITALLNAESIPITTLQQRVTVNSGLSQVYQALATQLQSLQTTAQSLEQPSTFQAATTTSSDPTVLTATADSGAALGTYNLQVARLVTTQQLISTGFTDPSQAKVGAGTITIDEGGGGLASQTSLADLNGGTGVGRGQFRITDRSGASSVIDTSSAISLDDVVNSINTADNISVRASIKNDKLVLTDSSGKTASDLIVQDLGLGTGAADLGIAGDVSGNTLTGTTINYLSRSTSLSQLNDGRGVSTLGTGNDLQVNLKDGANFKVNLATANTVGDVIDQINAASGGKVTASVPVDGSGLQLTDNTGGNGHLSVTALGGSNAAADLGLLKNTGGNSITGSNVIAGIDTTLLSSLHGGAGVPLGTVQFKNRAGTTGSIDFAGAGTVQDVLDDINNDSSLKLKATLNSSGSGIAITDQSNGTGNLVITDQNGGTTAATLGIAGNFDQAVATVSGSNQHKQWVTDSTLLSSLNGGKGIDHSKFTIANSKGAATTIDLTGSTITTVKDLLYQINSKQLNGVTASINADGNGIVFKDTSNGPGKLTVTDLNGTAAADLNVAGKATATSIDGAYEKTLVVGANDTLSTVQAAINNLNFGVTASVISDGSSTSPYRLSLTANNSGKAGQVVFDAGSTSLGTTNLVDAQDAAVFVGGSGTGKPLLVTSSTNQVTNVIKGVTLNLVSASSKSVQLSVTGDSSSLVTSLQGFVTTFNGLTAAINSQSSFNTSSNTAGLLLGDSVATSITSGLFSAVNGIVGTGGKFKVFSDIGITVGANDQLIFNQNKFQQAFAADPTGVQNLFSASTTKTDPLTQKVTTTGVGLGYLFDKALSQLEDPVSGTVTGAIKTLTAESQGFTDQITQLNSLLAIKKTQLQTEFANMENVLAGLQSQGAALGGISTVKTSSSNSSSGSTG